MILLYSIILIFFLIGIYNYLTRPYQWHGIQNISRKEINDPYRKFLCIFCSIIIIVLHGFINPDFSDLDMYNRALQTCEIIPLSEVIMEPIPGLKSEVGFKIWIKLISYISTSPEFFLTLTGIIINWGYYKTVKAYSPYVMLSFLLIMTGPFFQSLFVLRQHMAMSIILLTYPYIIKKKIIPYILLFTLAYSFHQSAIVFFPIYFIYHIKRIRNIIITYIIGGAVFSVGMLAFVQFFIQNIASGEASYDLDLYGLSTDGMNIKLGLLTLGLLLFRFYIMKKRSFQIGINRLLTVILLGGVIISLAGIGWVGASRLAMYLTGFFLVFPNTIAYIKTPLYKILAAISFWIVTLYMFIGNMEWATDMNLWFFSPMIS